MIYLDNAATTKPNEESVRAAEKFILSEYYNPSALYAEGYNLHLEIKKARSKLISLIADEEKYSLIFTSGGTEADNQAIFCGGKRGNVVTTYGEHAAVFAAMSELKLRGTEVRFADLNADGSVNVEKLLSLVDENTSLVSVIHVNNETGAINDVNSIAEKVKLKSERTLFHSDGVQAFGKIPFKLSSFVDLYSVSAHKIGGIKGCGALIKRKQTVIKPYIYGGGQEAGLRSGTENVFAIKCFEHAATSKYRNLKSDYEKVCRLNQILISKLNKSLFKVLSSDKASPYIVSVIADGLRGETVMHELNDKGLIVGTGSACSSNSKKRYSRVLLACGLKENMADGALRISFSAENTVQEIEEAAEIMNSVIKNRKDIMA